MKSKFQSHFLQFCVALIAFAFGYFLAGDSTEIQKLRTELDEAKRISPPAQRHSRVAVARRTTEDSVGTHSGSLGTTNVPWTTNVTLLSAGVTREDMALTRALEKQRMQGEFVLLDERPLFRKLQARDFEMISAQTATNNAAAYHRVFSEIGLRPEVSEGLQSHLAKIHKASLEAEASIAQVLDARKRFDERLRSLLGAEDYGRYRDYEASKPALHELENIQKFLQTTKNAFVDARYEQPLMGLIQATKAVEEGWWHGPYDPLPQVKMGEQEVRAWAEERLRQTTESANAMLQRLPEIQLPEEHASFVAEYYSKKIQERQAAIDFVASNPSDRKSGIILRQKPKQP